MPISRDMISAASQRIAPFVRKTPVLELPRGALGGDWVPILKLEFLQHAGSFKARGAFNNLLSRPIGRAGVAAASGGNHGAAVAYAAQVLGYPARVFVPAISAPAKVAAIRHFGADVIIGGARYDDAQAACDAYVSETGALKVHPFAGEETIAGQGSVAREWPGHLDSVLVAAGGGGLISGIARWWAGKVRIVGVEPEGSCALHAALAAGGPVTVEVNSVAADSLGARNVGPLVYQICKDRVDHVALVADDAILAAQRQLWRDFRIAVEPGGAAALAAVMSGVYVPHPGERVGILLCGANVDLEKIAAL